MNYCEKHKSFNPVCCQACVWDALFCVDLPRNDHPTATEIENRRAEKMDSLGLRESKERSPK